MQNKTFEKRFSERNAFWIVGVFFVFSLHIFLYFKIRAIFGEAIITSLWMFWGAFFSALPLITRKTKRIKSKKQLKWSDRVGSVYTLYIFIVSVILLFLDFIDLFIPINLSSGEIFLFSLALALIFIVFGIKQANTIQTTFLKVPTQKLPVESTNLRVVQLTDLHLGPWVGTLLLEQIVDKINKAEPDIIVVTGDLTDGSLDNREDELEILRKMKAPLGIFAVTGNHDYYDSIDSAIAFMESAGMKVLKTESIEVGGIIIAGVNDIDHLLKSKWGLSRSESLILSLERVQKEKFLLLLRHRPIIELGTEGHFDLQLSGHTHGGQLFPLFSSRHIIVGCNRGCKKLKCGGLLYVNNGAGFVGPPFRFMAPPEIAVIDIVKEEA
ncbi:MAG: metallophosphoesterase [Synergistaceae bacterium]|nr:metallophosphoesterase [Synergistaceae bacterium]